MNADMSISLPSIVAICLSAHQNIY